MSFFTKVTSVDGVEYILEHESFETVMLVIECNNGMCERRHVADGSDLRKFQFPKGAYKLYFEKMFSSCDRQNGDTVETYKKYNMYFYIGTIVSNDYEVVYSNILRDAEGSLYKVSKNSQPIITSPTDLAFKE